MNSTINISLEVKDVITVRLNLCLSVAALYCPSTSLSWSRPAAE